MNRMALGILVLAVSCTAGPFRAELRDGIFSAKSENNRFGVAIGWWKESHDICWAGHADQDHSWGCKEVK